MKTLAEITNRTSQIVLVDQDILDNEVMLLNEDINKKQEAKSQKLNHLDHIEDLMIRHGHEGMTKALDILTKTHDVLNGKTHKDFNIHTKFDGMGLVWGHHPDTNQFFVGTKSVFNKKTPKINYSDKDIEVNHGNSPGLAKKLKHALKHLPKVTPKSGIFQGDLMFTPGDIHQTEKQLSFSPNTLTYNIDKESDEGKSISAAKIGIAPHTAYDKKFNRKELSSNVFKNHSDVHLFDPTWKKNDGYTPEHQKKFSEYLAKADEHYKKYLNAGGSENITDHQPLLVSYINSTIKNRQDPSTVGYTGFLNTQFKKKTETLKRDKSKNDLKTSLDNEVQNVLSKKSAFNSLFSAHRHIQNAKKTLIDGLSKSSPYGETILGNKSKPEGYVVTHNGEQTKLVDRHHFSAANFDWNEKVNPSDNPTVLTFGRMNPPTAGHQRLLDTAADIARRSGAKNVNVTTRTQDKDNPLPPKEKMQWLKKAFPNHHVVMASQEANTIIDQLKTLHSNGVRHLTIVAGKDRIHDYNEILAKVNGPNKQVNFASTRVVSSGERDPSLPGVEGVSGTKMRDHVKNNNFTEFVKGLPSHINKKEGKKLFNSIKKNLE